MVVTVAENINIMSASIGPAMKGRDAGPIRKLAVACKEAGADYLDINLGPARKGGAEMMDWVVRTVHEVVDLPLYLDTTNVEAIEAGLKAHKSSAGKPVINSVSAVPARMDALLPLVKKYGCGMVALCYGPDGIPRDENERGALAAELLYRAGEAGIPPEDMWFDPIVVPVSSQQIQLRSCTAFMAMLPEIAPGAKSTCGLSNVSNGVCGPGKREILNQVYFMMLKRHGLYAAIVDALDPDLMAIAKDRRPDADRLVARLMDGERIDAGKPSKEERDIAKTYGVLSGDILFSDSWLEV